MAALEKTHEGAQVTKKRMKGLFSFFTEESDSSKPRENINAKNHDSSGKWKITQTIETTSANIRKIGGIFEGIVG